MICQNNKCKKEHDGSFGSGNFCCVTCANTRQFSKATLQKKSNSAKKRFLEKGRWGGMNHTPRSKEMIGVGIKRTSILNLFKTNFDELSLIRKRRRILIERQHRCEICKLNEWRGKPLLIEFHHINGNRKDNRRENILILCPNCHSQTDNWKNKTNAISNQLLNMRKDVEIYNTLETICR